MEKNDAKEFPHVLEKLLLRVGSHFAPDAASDAIWALII